MSEIPPTAQDVTVIGDRRYRLIDERNNSTKYGPCEVCGEFCSSIYSQDIEKSIGDSRWSYLGDTWGHKECLIALRDKHNPSILKETS